MLDGPLVFLDLETTGATATHDRITEVGIVEVNAGRLIGEWSTLVNPGISIPPAIQSLTGITNRMVALAPSFDEIGAQLRARLDGRLLVAHNARFDYGFLRNEFQRAGVRFSSRVLCTVRLSRKLFPRHARHNLDALMARHGIRCDARHRALGDARALWALVQRWQEALGAGAVASAAADLVKSPTVPAGLASDVFDDIPECPGVYLFHGQNGVVLYVGKSVNLRARVMSHFSGDHRVNKDMKIAREVVRIDWVETPGELGALIEESRLVKQLAPVYNRRLRRTAELCSWHWRNGDPECEPRLVRARDLDIAQFSDLYGLFRSRAAAIEALREIAAGHGLCSILLGLEKRQGPCFAHQIKRCRGACVGKESRETHALRLAQALADLRMQPWPFRGRIGVRETAPAGDRTEIIVLDRWCYLGTARSEADLQELRESRPQPRFDLDTYRILTRFFNGPRRDYTVVEMAA
ncbi:MAG: DNA polymerase III subunit epsilon [Betaproteobacteria bacterium]|nr:DNA polymerase III subunit epsilon [Betaproteobacteria bacterium]